MPDVSAWWLVGIIVLVLVITLLQAVAAMWAFQQRNHSELRLIEDVKREREQKEATERELGSVISDRSRLRSELNEIVGGCYATFSVTTKEDFDDDSTQDATVIVHFDSSNLSLEKVDGLADEILCGEWSAMRLVHAEGSGEVKIGYYGSDDVG